MLSLLLVQLRQAGDALGVVFDGEVWTSGVFLALTLNKSKSVQEYLVEYALGLIHHLVVAMINVRKI